MSTKRVLHRRSHALFGEWWNMHKWVVTIQYISLYGTTKSLHGWAIDGVWRGTCYCCCYAANICDLADWIMTVDANWFSNSINKKQTRNKTRFVLFVINRKQMLHFLLRLYNRRMHALWKKKWMNESTTLSRKQTKKQQQKQRWMCKRKKTCKTPIN